MRLSLAVADPDKSYVESFVEYVSEKYPQNFRISAFTAHSNLVDFLRSSDGELDILLLSQDFHSQGLPADKVDTLVILSHGKLPQKTENCIYKYQNCDAIVKKILDAFSQKHEDIVLSGQPGRKCVAFAVCSPVGGSGKTTIAYSLSQQLRKKGMSLFYLNLEYYQSTPALVKYDGETGMSRVIYYLKRKDENLPLRIAAASSTDPCTGISFFLPPDSATELEELGEEDLVNLVEGLRSTGRYDVVFIDMPSCLESRYRGLLKLCDEIILVVTQDAVAYAKLQQFFNELKIAEAKERWHIRDKLRLVLNRYREDKPCEVKSTDLPIAAVLPEVKDLRGWGWAGRIERGDAGFYEAIRGLAGQLIL